MAGVVCGYVSGAGLSLEHRRVGLSERSVVCSLQAPQKDKVVREEEKGSSFGVKKSVSDRGLRGVGRTVPLLVLNAVTVLWGSQHAVIKHAVDTDGMSPDVLNLDRFILAAMILTPFLLNKDERTKRREKAKGGETEGLVDPATLLAGAELGLWMFSGYALQSLGLLTTTAGKSAFLLYLNVKIVPILAATLYGRRIEPLTWISAAVAVMGTCFLCFDGGSPPVSGDLLSIAAAACSAMFILRLETAAKRHDPTQISVFSLWSTVFLCGTWTLFSQHPQSINDILPKASDWPAVAYLGVVTTALTTILQTFGQRFVRAEKAALVYALDPVYAALFSYLFIGEKLGEWGFVGAGLITIAAVSSQPQVMKAVRSLLKTSYGK